MGLTGKAEAEVEGPALEHPASSGMLTGGILYHSQGSKIFQLIIQSGQGVTPPHQSQIFYRTQVSLGSDLWVRLSVTNSKTFCKLCKLYKLYKL